MLLLFVKHSSNCLVLKRKLTGLSTTGDVQKFKKDGNVKRPAEDKVTDTEVETDTDTLEFSSPLPPDVNIKEEKQQKMKMGIAVHHSQIRRYRPTMGRVKEIPRIIILTVFVVRKFHYWSRVNLNYQGKLIFFYHIWILLTQMLNEIMS